MQQGDSNEYPQHTFLWRNMENDPKIIIKYPLYLSLWSSGQPSWVVLDYPEPNGSLGFLIIDLDRELARNFVA